MNGRKGGEKRRVSSKERIESGESVPGARLRMTSHWTVPGAVEVKDESGVEILAPCGELDRPIRQAERSKDRGKKECGSMKTGTFILFGASLVAAAIVLLGCGVTAGNIGYKAGYSIAQGRKMSAMIDAIYSAQIPIRRDPRLPQEEKTLLGLLPPLRTCVETLEDAREGIDGRVPTFSNPVDSIVTNAIKNEFERSGHALVAESNDHEACDFRVLGRVQEFSSLPFKLVTDEAFKKANNQYNWVTSIVFEIQVEGAGDCRSLDTLRYSRVRVSKWTGERGYDAVPSYEQVGAMADEGLLILIRELSNDKEFIRILACRKDAVQE